MYRHIKPTFNLPDKDKEFGTVPDYNNGSNFTNGGTTTRIGFILFNLMRTRDNTITVKINNTTYTIWGGAPTYNNYNQFCIIPVNKGDTFSCNYAPTNLVFYPAKSVQNLCIKY